VIVGGLLKRRYAVTFEKSFAISIPTDNGFIGRACNDDECGQYFKVLLEDLKETMYCPYCGATFDKSHLMTTDQVEHVGEAAIEEVRDYAIDEIQKMFGRAFRGSKNISFKPSKKRTKRKIEPKYEERQVDTGLKCPDCETSFQVYGIFGYCPRCRCENLQIYDANWTIVEKEIDEAADPRRQLRRAYGDLVSMFEDFCKHKAAQFTTETANFQVLKEARKFFEKYASVHILSPLRIHELLALRRVFHKRHACVHAGGKVTEKYIQMIPEDNKLPVGSLIPLSKGELVEGATAMRKTLGILVQAIEERG
jgi:hypothetical protein